MHSAGAIWQAAVKFSIPSFASDRVSPGEQNITTTTCIWQPERCHLDRPRCVWQGIVFVKRCSYSTFWGMLSLYLLDICWA